MSEVRLELLRDTYGFMVTQAIAAMARAGVADLVAEQPLTTAELAAQTGLTEDSLHRIVRALAELGIFSFVEGRVVNTPKSEFLRVDIDGSVTWIAQSLADEHYRAWTRSEDSFRTGQAATPAALGEGYFDWLDKHPAEAATFNRAMAAGSMLRVRVVAELPWSNEVVVDVGGGTGTLLAELLAGHSRLRGVVYDLPHAEAGALASIEAAGVAERCEFTSGDFFSGVPSGGDVYVLSHILHDWDDEPAIRILQACRAAMSPDSRLLVVDAVVPDGPGGVMAKLIDLHMLVLIGGRERTATQWKELLGAAGFRLAEIRPGPFPVIVARPVPSPAETT